MATRIVNLGGLAPARAPQPGSISVRSHLHLASGFELVIDPLTANLNSEQVRKLAQGVLQLYANLQRDQNSPSF